MYVPLLQAATNVQNGSKLSIKILQHLSKNHALGTKFFSVLEFNKNKIEESPHANQLFHPKDFSKPHHYPPHIG